MIVVLLNVYLVLLFILVRLRIVPFNLFWKVSPILVLFALLVGLFIPMNWGAPQGSVLVVRNSVPIIPNVAGEVVEVPVAANTPLKTGEVLFRIDPTPFQSKVDALQAQLDLANTRLGQMTRLRGSPAGREFDVEERQAQVDQLTAELAGARYDLDKTTVRAPADGYVTNLALRTGARVSTAAPAMAFIDTADTIVGVEIAQIYARFVAMGQPVEVTFNFFPGKVFSGTVEAMLQAVATGQVQASGLAVTPEGIATAPLVVRVRLDDAEVAQRLPAGATGVAAIFTEEAKVAHVIRKVLLRQVAITNYVNPF